MAVELGDIIGQIGTGVYRLVKGKDVNITDADALSTGSDDDIILVDEDAQGLQSSTKKLSLSNLWNYILSKFTSTSSTTQVLYNQSGSIKGEADFVYDESNNKLTVTKLSSTEITGALTSIGNLTGDVTSINRTTTIANDVVAEAKLKTSNAPTNGYVLTAQSGNIGGLTWQEPLNLFKGITTTSISLAPNEFNVTSHSTFNVVTRDNIGSVKPSAYQSLGRIYATCFVPLGYEVTDVDIYASQNRNIEVLTSKVINDSTSSRGTGTANTTLTLGTAWESVADNYLILSFEQGADRDEIYGAKITIQAV